MLGTGFGVANGVGVGAGAGVEPALLGKMKLPSSVSGADGEFEGDEVLPEIFAGPQF
jgi:hypothetical protein